MDSADGAGRNDPADAGVPREVHAAGAEAVAVPAPPAPAAVPELPPAACAAGLAQRFPALFGAGRALPIKLRVQADIQQRAPGVFSRKSLSLFLHRHTTSTAYIRALAEAPHRFDLDGQPAGDVAEEHRAAALAELERGRAIVAERRAAEREAMRQARRPGPRAPGDGGLPSGAGAVPAEQGGPVPGPQPRQGQGPTARPGRPQGPRDGPRDGPQRSAGDGRSAPGPSKQQHSPRDERPASRPQGPPSEPGSQHEGPHAAPRPPRPQRSSPPVAGAAAPAQAAVHEALPSTPEQAAENEARRSRAVLLRAYETSTLTRANFCVLKRIDEATLEALLVQARQERGAQARPLRGDGGSADRPPRASGAGSQPHDAPRRAAAPGGRGPGRPR